jgi:hypothetical protein
VAARNRGHLGHQHALEQHVCGAGCTTSAWRTTTGRTSTMRTSAGRASARRTSSRRTSARLHITLCAAASPGRNCEPDSGIGVVGLRRAVRVSSPPVQAARIGLAHQLRRGPHHFLIVIRQFGTQTGIFP